MVGSEGTLGFISEITYRTVPDHGDKASALILFETLEGACAAVSLLAHAPVAAVELADRAALRSVETKPGMPRGPARRRPGRRRAPRRDTSSRCCVAAPRHRRGRDGPARRPDVRAGPLLDRCGRVRALLERAQGHVPLGRRGAQDRHDRDHRGRRIPGRSPGGGHARPAVAAARAWLRRGDHLRPRARRQPALRLHAGLQRRLRGCPLRALHGRALPHGRRAIRRVAQGRARHRTQHRAVRRARVGSAGVRVDARDQADVRPAGHPEPRRRDQRRSARARRQPQAASCRRPAGRHLHRMRLLRAEVPVARPHAFAAATDRRMARDRARGACRDRRLRDARRVRLRRHRHLRRLRAVRDGVPGGHRDRPLDQGAARPSCVQARARRRERGRRSLRCRDRGRSCRPRGCRCAAWPARAGRAHAADGHAASKMVADASPACVVAARAAGRSRRFARVLPELRRADDGCRARRRRASAADGRPAPVSPRRDST